MEVTSHVPARSRQDNPLTWPFLLGFVGCCVLFWWLQSILLHFWLGMGIPLQPKFIWISIGALLTFALGYILPGPGSRGLSTPRRTMDQCEAFAYKATILLAVPALVVALRFAAYRLTVESYFEGQGISLAEQAVLYAHLFIGLLYIGAVADPRQDRRKLWLIIFLTIAPRLAVSFGWRRFFAAQAILPIVFIGIARGWIRLDFKRVFQIVLIGSFVLFVPAMTRGDKIFGQDPEGRPQIVNYFGYMNSLGFFQDNTDLTYPCPPLLVSLTAKAIPYSILKVCTIDLGDDKDLPATTDRLLTKRYTDDPMAGTGSIYLLELFLTGGIPAILVGSTIFGFTCRRFVQFIGHRSLYAGIWAECLSRAWYAPRGNLGYVYERIPSLILAIFGVIALSWAVEVLRRSKPVIANEDRLGG
jgi:hypothetical protein